MYDNLIITEESATCQLLPVNPNTTNVFGETRLTAKGGAFCFGDFKIVADPGTTV